MAENHCSVKVSAPLDQQSLACFLSYQERLDPIQPGDGPEHVLWTADTGKWMEGERGPGFPCPSWRLGPPCCEDSPREGRLQAYVHLLGLACLHLTPPGTNLPVLMIVCVSTWRIGNNLLWESIHVNPAALRGWGGRTQPGGLGAQWLSALVCPGGLAVRLCLFLSPLIPVLPAPGHSPGTIPGSKALG